MVQRKPKMLLPSGGRRIRSPGLAVILRKKIRSDSVTESGTVISEIRPGALIRQVPAVCTPVGR